MVASKSSSKHAIFGFQKRGNQNSGNGEPVSHALSHTVNICVYTRMIGGEKFTRSAISTLHFIRNKQSIIISAYRFHWLLHLNCRGTTDIPLCLIISPICPPVPVAAVYGSN